MILPTLEILAYLILVAGVYLFRLSYLGWFGPYLLAFVIAAPLLMLFLSLNAMLRVRAELIAPPRCGKGERASLYVRLKGLWLLPLPGLNLRIEIENRFAGKTWQETIRCRNVCNGDLELELPTELCGCLRCRITRFEVRDLSGLFLLRKKGEWKARCTVMPKPCAPQLPLDLQAALNARVVLKPKYGGGYSEDHELREYRPGDTVNSIHWKLSSKTDSVIVREPLVNANTDVFLVLSRTDADDRGLEVLYWLSLELCSREIPHLIVADSLYTVSNESESANAIAGLLSQPRREPCPFDPAKARAVFHILGGEVRWQ